MVKDEGVLTLVIPDKRACFDYFRPVTSLSEFIDRHDNGLKRPSSGSIAEFLLNSSTHDGQIAWSLGASGNIETTHSPCAAINLWREATRASDYYDVHMSCFVPHVFRLLIHDLNALGFSHLKELSVSATVECEFYVSLSRAATGVLLERSEPVSTNGMGAAPARKSTPG